MAEHNVKINVKTDTGYDQLYPKTKSDIVDFDKTSSNLSSTNVEAAIKEVNTKASTATSTANTNKTNIGTLSSLTTDSKTNLVGAINEVDSHANTAQSTANTNKTNIGTLSNLKTAIKTSIVNAINSLYDNTIGKTLETLDEVELATEKGFYADALVAKEINNKIPKVTSLTSGQNGVIDFHRIKIIYGAYPLSAFSYDSAIKKYTADIDLTSYKLTGSMWANVSALYNQGSPIVTLETVNTSKLSLISDVSISGAQAMWIVIGASS